MLPKSYKLIIAILVAEYVIQTSSQDLRILGGHNAKKNQFPHMVSIQYEDLHGCGGAIISPSWVVTAAHCVLFFHLPTLHIVAGIRTQLGINPDKQVRYIKKEYMHENYRPRNNTYDIGLLELEEPLDFNDAVKPIALPAEGQKFTGNVVVSGWGVSKLIYPFFPNRLQYLNLEIIGTEECVEILENQWGYPYKVTDMVVCGLPDKAKQSICLADSGSPVIQNEVLVGIVHGCGVSCGQLFNEPSPSIFTPVGDYISYIKRYVTDLPNTK